MSVAIQAENFAGTLTAMVNALANAPANELIDGLKTVVHQAHAANFTNAADSSGSAWQLRKYHGDPLKDLGRSGYPGHPLLIDLGVLFQSVTSEFGQDHIGETLDRAFSTGTDLPYAAYHEYGTDKLPQRSFIGVSDGSLDQMQGMVSDWGWSVLVGV